METGLLVLEKKIFEGFLPYMDMAAIMVMSNPSYTLTILAPIELRFIPIYQIGMHRHDS